MNDDQKLDNIIVNIVDTFKFQGVEITDFNISKDGIPEFCVNVSKSQKHKSTDDVLNFVYWTLWTLTYGKHADNTSGLEIILNYKEVE